MSQLLNSFPSRRNFPTLAPDYHQCPWQPLLRLLPYHLKSDAARWRCWSLIASSLLKQLDRCYPQAPWSPFQSDLSQARIYTSFSWCLVGYSLSFASPETTSADYPANYLSDSTKFDCSLSQKSGAESPFSVDPIVGTGNVSGLTKIAHCLLSVTIFARQVLTEWSRGVRLKPLKDHLHHFDQVHHHSLRSN